jgi:hypothetical protein
VNATARDEVRDGVPASGSEAASLVESAMLLRWRAPELALLLANRAVAAAGEHRPTVLRAEHLAVFALNRLERHADAAYRLLAALRDAELPAELRHELHVELANCAAALGEPGTALDVLRPVLAAGDDIAAVPRGMALIATAESTGMLGRGDAVTNVVTSALAEADEIFREEPHLDRDTALLLRATAKAVDAMRHRRAGASLEAETQARSGRELLAGLADPEHDSGQVSGRLMLELVLALLDRGRGDVAVHESRPLLRRPVRAAAAGAVGWLRLALATRVHLAEARHEPALALLADGVEVAQRHGMDAVLAECLEGLSHVHEVRGEFADALHCLRSARAAEVRNRRTVETARSALIEHFGVRRQEIPGLVDQIGGLLSGTGWLRAVPDPDTGLLDAEEYACRVEASLGESAPLSQVLVAVGPGAGEPVRHDLMIELGRRLRDVAPERSALGQITGDRIAVLLPATDRVQAQSWADRFRVRTIAELGIELIVGVAQYRMGSGPDQFLADAVLALPATTDSAQATARRSDRARERERATGEPVTVILSVIPPAEGNGGSTNGRSIRGSSSWESAPAGLPSAPNIPDRRQEITDEPGVADPVPADPVPGAGTPADVDPSDPGEPPGAHRRRSSNGAPVLVSDLLPRSLLSAGRSGRRRAEDRDDDRARDHTEDRAGQGFEATSAAEVTSSGDVTPSTEAPASVEVTPSGEAPPSTEVSRSPELMSSSELSASPGFNSSAELGFPAVPTSPAARIGERNTTPVAHTGTEQESTPAEPPEPGPSPPPTPRTFVWGSSGSGGESDAVGMGDLLAEALAAFQESAQPLRDAIDMIGPGGAVGEHSVDPTTQRGRPSNLQLATDPVNRHRGRVNEALTDPELRLPDLTAEPRWRPPGPSRRSAAGD